MTTTEKNFNRLINDFHLITTLCTGKGVIAVLSSMKSIKMCYNTKKVSVKKRTILIRQPCQAVALLKAIKLGGLQLRPIPT